MNLQALSAATGVTVPSIKYYLREGLLHPGVKKNATTAVYDDTYRARLDLIQALRQIVGTPVGEIRRLTTLIDAPAPVIYIMSAAQALGAAAVFPGDDDEPGQPAQELVAHLLRDRGWPDRASAARRGVEKLLTEMAAGATCPPSTTWRTSPGSSTSSAPSTSEPPSRRVPATGRVTSTAWRCASPSGPTAIRGCSWRCCSWGTPPTASAATIRRPSLRCG